MFGSKALTKNTRVKNQIRKLVGSLYTYSMFTLYISIKLTQAYNAMYMLTWVVEYPKEVILLSSS